MINFLTLVLQGRTIGYLLSYIRIRIRNIKNKKLGLQKLQSFASCPTFVWKRWINAAEGKAYFVLIIGSSRWRDKYRNLLRTAVMPCVQEKILRRCTGWSALTSTGSGRPRPAAAPARPNMPQRCSGPPSALGLHAPRRLVSPPPPNPSPPTELTVHPVSLVALPVTLDLPYPEWTVPRIPIPIIAPRGGRGTYMAYRLYICTCARAHPSSISRKRLVGLRSNFVCD